MQRYIIGLHVFGFLPLFYAIIHYVGDVWTYLTSDDEEELQKIHMWKVKLISEFSKNCVNFKFCLLQGMSYGLLWYAFIVGALQVHSFSVYFAWNLVKAWRARGTRKVE